MTDHSTLMMFAVLVVAFIAGYSVISYAVRKFKEGAAHPAPRDQDRTDSDPTSNDNSALKSKTGDPYQRSHDED